jgi:hypothetical protein
LFAQKVAQMIDSTPNLCPPLVDGSNWSWLLFMMMVMMVWNFLQAIYYAS